MKNIYRLTFPFLLFLFLNVVHADDIIFVPGWFTEKAQKDVYELPLQEIYPRKKINIFKWQSNSLNVKKVLENADTFAGQLFEIIKEKTTAEQSELILIGHSFGGRIVVKTASALAENNITIKKIILLGAAVDYDVDLDSIIKCSKEPIINVFSRNDSVLKYLYGNYQKKFALGFCGSELLSDKHFIQYSFSISEPLQANIKITNAVVESIIHLARYYLEELKRIKVGELKPYKPEYDYSEVVIKKSFASIPSNWIIPPVFEMEVLDSYADWSFTKTDVKWNTKEKDGNQTEHRLPVYFVIDPYGQIALYSVLLRNTIEKRFSEICKQIKPFIESDTELKQQKIDFYRKTNDDTGKNTVEVSEAEKKYHEAAEQGNIEAQTMLGICYAEGSGIEQDERKAKEWLGKAADQEFAPAQFYLGLLLFSVEQNYDAAAELFCKAAKQHYAPAQFALSACYVYGVGVEQDNRKAIEWLSTSAGQGYALAQFELGECLKNGTGIAKDMQEAVKFYSKAAKQHYAPAQFALGFCYETGDGIEKNISEAAKLYYRAAKQGVFSAEERLRYLDVSVGGFRPPILVSFRESKIDSTKVMLVTNSSASETLELTLDVYSDIKDKSSNHKFKVKPGKTSEIGRLQMWWSFVSGEQYSLQGKGYLLPIEGIVP